MTSDHDWEAVRDLFLDLADLPARERDEHIARVTLRDPALAERVRDLLAHDAPPSPGTQPRRRFGPYEVLRPVGRGGMGEVFVARRADGEFEREVAVKLLRGGVGNEELVKRFLRERQTLARLDHEYIASLLDGGTTEEGEPYLVMEYVDGVPADTFAAKLELKDRLALFLRIGQAVRHAHERGFVHRDLKPSNILVRADGTPRLLDFGIARLDETRVDTPPAEPLTRTGHRMFTPEYASPEQVLGEVATARSDIFSLGVVLYAFLTGHGPWQTGGRMHELELAICESDPAPPSRRVTGTTRTRMAGDLDAVVLQCLAKRPERRYPSVAALCDDIERYLDGRPILARRTGPMERAIRFARRKPLYPVTAVLLSAAVVAGLFAWDSRGRAEGRRGELSAAVGDRIETARTLWADGQLDAASAELDAALLALAELPDEPALEAAALAQRAVFSNFQDDWDESLDLVARAEELLERVESPDPRDLARLYNTRAQVLFQREPGDASMEAARVAVEFANARLAQGDVLRIDAMLDWADELRRTGAAEDALGVLVEALEETRARDPKSETISRLLNEQALLLSKLGRREEAVERYREALETLTWHRGAGHVSFARVRINLGATLFLLGRLEEAREEYEQGLAITRDLEMDLAVASCQHFLGRIAYAQGELAWAEEAAREAMAIREANDMGLHTTRSRSLLGLIRARRGARDEARELLAPVVAGLYPGLLLADMEADVRAVFAGL